MKKILLVVLLATYSISYSQNSLSGTITAADDHAPLEGVSVYFPQLEKGGVTDMNGAYTILNIPKGSFKIVASYIGFQTSSKSIVIGTGENTLDLSLSPSAIEMDEVIVSTPFHKLQRENVMKVEHVNIEKLKAAGNMTLAQGITDIPGVSSVSTGMGIGKPVIRGLSSNRVLVYAQGVRLENQQFGDEHGLGLSDAGIESVEVIKGPASLLYGSDAMGGVLYLNPEKFAASNTTKGDINLDYYSNTEGLSANAGIKTSLDKFKFLLRLSGDSHVDYKTGDNDRVTNSRFKEYDLKTGIGYQTTDLKTELRYNYNKSVLGIPEAIEEQTKSRTPDLPYQPIENHILSSKTNVFFENSSLEATLGYTFNNRKELEDSEDDPALHMNLATFSYNLQYHLPKWGRWETIAAVQGMHQTNKNFGEELLIPDATTNDIGAMATSHLHLNDKHDFQFGLRYDHRGISTGPNGEIGTENYIADLDRDFNSFNAALGYKLNMTQNLLARVNLATGFRAPNLAELTSNGVHEGTNRFEIGNPDLSNERNLQTDISLEYKNQHVEWYMNGFYNKISDYIYLQPNGENVDNTPVYNYNQQNANLYGGEIGFHLHPRPIDWLHWETNFQTVMGKLTDGDYLPLIPANCISNTLRVEFDSNNTKLKKYYAFVTLRSTFAQHHVGNFETESDGYNLLDMGLGGTLTVFKQPVDIHLSGNNLLNNTYISHLSRLKTDGIANMGRNINLGVSIPL